LSRSLALFLIALLLMASKEAVPQALHPFLAEQTQFSAEDEGVKRPTPIPAEVMAQFAQVSFVRDAMEIADPPLKQPPARWFSASVVHLAGPDEKDLIVEAEGRLVGGNVTNFWIFRLLPDGPQLVLNGPAHDLIVLRRRKGGLREIELESATSIKLQKVMLRFNGTRYVVFKDRTEDIT
jgi:hypothetical protein